MPTAGAYYIILVASPSTTIAARDVPDYIHATATARMRIGNLCKTSAFPFPSHNGHTLPAVTFMLSSRHQRPLY
jgi:hypothetical protein